MINTTFFQLENLITLIIIISVWLIIARFLKLGFIVG